MKDSAIHVISVFTKERTSQILMHMKHQFTEESSDYKAIFKSNLKQHLVKHHKAEYSMIHNSMPLILYASETKKI